MRRQYSATLRYDHHLMMKVLHTALELDAFGQEHPGALALVPTMGALHAGHRAHVESARQAGAERVVVSIFVNPTQFGPGEDYARYPRTLDADLTACASVGVDAVFVPTVETMYPAGAAESLVDVPSITRGLEGAFRPGHFAGVGRVVLKLLGLVRPQLATFGRKDFQQLALIQALVHDLRWPVRIVEVPTLREADGLAMSSRNRYLTDEQRKRAVGISQALGQAHTLCNAGERDPAALEASMRSVLQQHGFDAIDYAVVRHRTTLQPVPVGFDPSSAVALITARMGTTRLLDNRLLET